MVTGQQPDTRAVSATKDALPIVETSQSVSVVDRSDLDLRGVENLNEALRFTAGVGPETRGDTGTARYDLFTLRGFTVDQYLDGLRLISSQNGYAAPQIDVTRLERVEVVKGPASVLYGQGSSGGIVALSSELSSMVNERVVIAPAPTADLSVLPVCGPQLRASSRRASEADGG